MSDKAEDVLQQMRADADQAKGSTAAAPDDANFYVKLRILKLRRQQLMIALAATFIVFTVLITRDYRKDRGWWLTGLPIAAVGLMIALIPPSEEWEYKPWQARARQYERNQINR